VTAKSEGYESFSPNECYSDNFGAADERFSVPGSSALFPFPSRSVAFPPRVATRRDRFGKSSPARQLQGIFFAITVTLSEAQRSRRIPWRPRNHVYASSRVAEAKTGATELKLWGNAPGFESPTSSAALRLDFAFDPARDDRR